MKRLKEKLLRRNRSEDTTSGRITNETVAEHREQILAGGRKFKYPVQYTRHKLVINTIIIGIITLAFIVLVGWWQLYLVENTSRFMYRVTQLIPVPVASVDGEWVKYSDYLKKLRSSIHFAEQQNQINTATNDGKRQVEFFKRQEMNGVERDAFTSKLARESGVSVNNKEVQDYINAELRASNVSEQAYERNVLNSFFDWSLDEYRSVVRAELLERKLSFKIDENARKKADRVLAAASAAGSDFAALATAESDDPPTRQNGGVVGNIQIDNQDSNGLIAAAQKLEPNQTSGLIKGTDGYYIIKLITKDPSTVNYSLIKIALTELDNKFDTVKKQGKIKEYIKLAP